jgi:hypothetical protein
MNAVADDYENLEMIQTEVAKWSQDDQIRVSAQEVIDALLGLVRGGLVTA